jgi:hypothetical protein
MLEDEREIPAIDPSAHAGHQMKRCVVAIVLPRLPNLCDVLCLSVDRFYSATVQGN